MALLFTGDDKVYDIITQVNEDGSIRPYYLLLAGSQAEYRSGNYIPATLPEDRYIFAAPSEVVQIVKWFNQNIIELPDKKQAIKINYLGADNREIARIAGNFLRRLLTSKCKTASDITVKRPEGEFAEIITAPKTAFNSVRKNLAGIDLSRVTLETARTTLGIRDAIGERRWRKKVQVTVQHPSSKGK